MLGAWCWILGTIQLTGVTGTDLRARAFFDANNVKVGDPMVLTIDFIGRAEFADLHPPALANAVVRKDWKLDDVSAKTDTFRDARRLTYRVRPMREGVLWFPALEFEYVGEDGSKRIARSNEIPVHAKGGAQVVVAEMGEETNEMPKPPELVYQIFDGCVPGPNDDELIFAWRKAMAKPSADAFAEFDFPAARMNEATCAIREGNWARAMKIYQKLEWTAGQTPEIEQGMIAALALKHDNPAVELPVWRQVLRPLLIFGWKGRVGIVLGGFAALALFFWLLGRGIRAVACLALAAGLVTAAPAEDLFDQIFGNRPGFHFGVKERREPIRITASFATSKPTVQVGDGFEFVIALEHPKTASVGQVRIIPSDDFGLVFTGDAYNLTDGHASNPSNVVRRIAIPARYDVPYKGQLSFVVEGMVTGSSKSRTFSFSFSNSFRAATPERKMDVRSLPSAGQPEDFSGIVSEGMRIHETCDILRVETNDVVTITYRLYPHGYVPAEFLLPGAAFEWGRQNDGAGRLVEIEYRRYFVADGSAATPIVKVPYYDPRTKSYKTATVGGTALKYDIMSSMGKEYGDGRTQ